MKFTLWITAAGIAIKIIGVLRDMMKEAAKFFDGVPDSGKMKKEYVMNMVRQMALGLCEYTGDDLDRVIMKVEAMVDVALEFFYTMLFKDDPGSVETPAK